VQIHAIQTGTVAVKTRQREGAGSGKRRFLNMLLDRDWTEPLPIYAFLIEHEQGPILVDTGETARTAEPGYFPSWHPYFRSGLREWVREDEEIGPQLERLGFSPGDVRRVVMTHLHTDHAGGLHHFPHSEILASPVEIEQASGLMGRAHGYFNHRFPDWLDLRPLQLDDEPFGPFPTSKRLTRAGDVVAIAAPGHTPGQIAVAVLDDDATVLIAGDSSYTQGAMLHGIVDGVAPDDQIAKTTLARIRDYAASTPTVHLPSHDPGSAERLAGRSTVGSARRVAVAV
jgi:glyoxylase-like metal-dependent hydrolase (beta-lactamase superfamily II)